MKARRAAFWVAVGATAIGANFLLELAADKVHVKGLRRFVEYVHRGHGAGESA